MPDAPAAWEPPLRRGTVSLTVSSLIKFWGLGPVSDRARRGSVRRLAIADGTGSSQWAAAKWPIGSAAPSSAPPHISTKKDTIPLLGHLTTNPEDARLASRLSVMELAFAVVSAPERGYGNQRRRLSVSRLLGAKPAVGA